MRRSLHCLSLLRQASCLQLLSTLAPNARAAAAASNPVTSSSTRPFSSRAGSSRHAWDRWSASLGLAAAAAALWQSQSTSALADAHAPDKPPTCQAWHRAARAAAQQAVSDAFQEALLDWQRSTAQHSSTTGGTPPEQPRGQAQQPQAQPESATNTTSSSSSSSASSGHSNEPQQPRVTYDGHQVSVTIPLLPGVDLPALLQAVQAGVDNLVSHSKRVKQQQQSWLLSTQRVQHWKLSRLVGGKADSSSNPAGSNGTETTSTDDRASSMQQLTVQVVVPLKANSPHEASGSSGSHGSSDGSSDVAGAVQVAKAAPFTADELELLRKLVAAANKLGTGQGFGRPGSYLSPWGLSNGPDRVLGGVDKLGGALLGSVLSELLQELQHGLDYDEQQQQQEVVDGLDQWDWGGRMDRFFGGLSRRLGEGLEKQVGDEGGLEEQMQSLQQLLQQEFRAMTPPDVIDWLHQLTQQERDLAGAGDAEDIAEPWTGDRRRHSGDTSSSSSSSGGSSGSSRQSLGSSSDGQLLAAPQQQQQQPLLPWQQPTAQSAMRQLEQLGAAVYLPTAAALQAHGAEGHEQQWGVLAGYEAQKQALEDCLLLPLKHPEVYERVSARTRATAKAGGARPRAVLFEGPPGTGKTSTARVLSGRASLPLVYVPLESLVSKWYGESEQNMSKIFKSCEALGGCIIFLDELDSLATSRDQGDMHEASRRLLGVLLREIDGFNHRDSGSSSSDGSGGDSSKRSVVIGATNRRQDLDAALLSRFDMSIHFGLPDEACRAAILLQYAHQLSAAEREQIATVTKGFSGRDLRDVCEQTERAWASKIIRGQVEPEQLPGLQDYLAAVQQRREGAGRSTAATAAGPGGHSWA